MKTYVMRPCVLKRLENNKGKPLICSYCGKTIAKGEQVVRHGHCFCHVSCDKERRV